MLAPDIVSLRRFYATALGEAAAGLLGEAIGRLWPDAHGDAMICIGYGMPYLGRYLNNAQPLAVCMPAGQGAAYWPAGRANLVCLAGEAELPFRDNSINRVLLVHSVENSEQLSWMMREVWRVLTPEGRLLAAVPNRLGLWSHASRSPFGSGRPFTMAQLRDLVAEQNFSPLRSDCALFMPPTQSRLCWKIAPRLERAGRWLGLNIGGVLLLEAEKQVYAPIQQPAVQPRAYRVPVAGVRPIMGRNHPA